MDPGIIIVAANKTGRDDLMPKEKIIQHKMEIITDIKTIMRDGTVLYGDLYKPQGEGKFPAILLRYIFKKELAPLGIDLSFVKAVAYYWMSRPQMK